MTTHIENLRKLYAEISSPEEAHAMEQYMRNLFPYFGIKSKPRTAILQNYFRENPIKDPADQKQLIELLYLEKEREFQYAALFLAEKYIKKQAKDYIQFLEFLICTKSWWETVDWTNKLVGIHFKRYPTLQQPFAEKWIESDNFWLQRIAIIHQLTFKENTNWSLLKAMIIRRIDSPEFFVRKAIGWSLRQYAKFEQERVISFVNQYENQLSGLSKREAMKNIK